MNKKLLALLALTAMLGLASCGNADEEIVDADLDQDYDVIYDEDYSDEDYSDEDYSDEDYSDEDIVEIEVEYDEEDDSDVE